MRCYYWLIALALSSLCLPTHAQSDAQKRAIAAYPQIAIQGSPLNQRFVELYNARRASEPDFFSNTEWPLQLAKDAAAAVNIASGKADAEASTTATIVLASGWEKRRPGTSADEKEIRTTLRTLLSPYGQPSTDTSTEAGAEFYHGGVTYLMPLAEAAKKLGADRPKHTRIKVTAVGFPDGLFAYTYEGSFSRAKQETPYPKLVLITDVHERVVCLQFVNDKQERWKLSSSQRDGCRLYDLVAGKLNRRKELYVGYFWLPDALYQKLQRFSLYMDVFDPQKEQFHHRAAFYAPPSFVNLMLHCCRE